ncbi:MAG TPA: UbiD family decarboxylase [Thermoleophilaceae bacterium]|nr:UbiD family decarboxylase [Thermoleophilaceae bacterium]
MTTSTQPVSAGSATDMADLRGFLDSLGAELHVIDDEIDPVTQAGILSSESRHPYLLTNLKGFPDWRFTDILASSRELQGRAFGTPAERVVPELAERIFKRQPTKRVLLDDAPCKEVKLIGDEADIRRLPIPIHSVGDGGRYLGSGMTVTKDPDSGIANVAIIRTHIRDDEPRRVGFWMAARHNWAHYMKHEARGDKMPMAFVIGLHPAYEILANYSGDHTGFDEFELAASVIGEDLPMVRCETIDLEVPAASEIVIEGLVPPEVREPEGPFGEFTGFQGGKVGTAPVMEITAITHRRDPIFRHMQATLFTDHQPLVALPMEAALFKRVSEVQGGMAIHDVHVPGWASLFVAIIQMTPRWDGQAQAVGLAALSSVNLHPKVVIVVDEDVDIYNAEDVIWALSTRMDPQRHVHVIPNERIHPLDQSVPPFGTDVTVMRFGGKVVLDATKPPTSRATARREFTRVTPQGRGDTTLDAVLAQIREFDARTNPRSV